jgi:hypothetical protein
VFRVRVFLTILIAIALVWWAWHGLTRAPIEHGSGVLAPDDPVQRNIRDPKPFRHGEYTITPVADFAITARVLGAKRYRFDSGAELCPVDLALGWGRMSDSDVLKSIKVRQHHRFYHWNTPRFPIPKKEIVSHSANMHMVPANDEILSRLKKVRQGHIVVLRGYLVNVSRDDGWHWNTSQTREDAGDGACELVYVAEISLSDGRGGTEARPR